MRQLMISIDVEAQPARAAGDPLERLIWGRFPGSEEAGIGRMMSIAEKHGVKLTMFLDYCEEGLYGDALLDVAREIHRRGHDLQLHAHLDFMPKSFWEAVGGTPEYNLNRLSPELAKASVETLCDAQLRATGKAATAFRGGGYRYCGNLLDALMAQGVRLNSSVNISRNTQPVELANSKQFLWSDGCLEVPVSVVEGYRNLKRPFDFNFNAMSMPDPAAMMEFLNVFHAERGEDAVAVLVMHSWSLLNLTDNKHFTHVRPDLIERLDGFLSAIKGKSRVVTSEDVLAAHDAGHLGLDAPQNFSALPKREGAVPVVSSHPASPISEAITPVIEIASDDCPICATPKRKIVDMNGRHCPKCRSLERQRVLSLVLDKGRENLPEQKLGKMLFVSPSQAEREVFKAWPETKFTTVDVRPEARTDLQADICAMPQVADAAFDTVFASYVMMCVHDLKGALGEIERVLKPGGTFISVEQVRYGEASRESADDKTITGWYGAEALEKYKVGSFRTLGKDDYEALLKTYFDVTVLEGIDPVTKLKLPAFFARKKPTQVPALAQPATHAMPAQQPVKPMSERSSKALAAALFATPEREKAMIDDAERLWASSEPVDQQKAVNLFFQALHLYRNAMASYRLGYAHLIGQGVERNPHFASVLLKIAVAAELRYAHLYMGRALADPENPYRNYALARAFFEKALKAGVELAQIDIDSLPRDTGVSERQFSRICTLCGTPLKGDAPVDDACGACGSRARSRTAAILCEDLEESFEHLGEPEERTSIGFAMPECEHKLLSRHFERITSVSLYGDYRGGHIEGVDARDLSRFPNESFDSHFSILLFDYFPEQEVALAEAYRVLRPGGVLMTTIAPYRLVDGDAAPFVTDIIQKRVGYFDYVPDDANMPSIRVGRAWFVKAMERAGFVAQHLTLSDPATGQVIDWFIGTKPGEAKKKPINQWAGLAGRSADGFVQLDNGVFRAKPIAERTDLKSKVGEEMIIYKAQLPEGSGANSITVALSELYIGPDRNDFRFAEHVCDPKTGKMTPTVILCGTGTVLVSYDLGLRWNRIAVPDAKTIRMWNCFTTASGAHLVQSHGWQGSVAGEANPDIHGVIFRFDKNWNFLGRSKAGDADWHGTASIGQRGDVIMFAEYYNNIERYYPDFELKREDYMKVLRSCSIWRSTDDGASWSKVLSVDPLDVRHFHTVLPDPFLPGTWWASSGDKARETRVWRSDDDGLTWTDVSNTEPDITLPPSFQPHRQAAQRYTDVIIDKFTLMWGADDFMGNMDEYDQARPLHLRAGSRLYISPKTNPLQPREIAYFGQPVRKFMDVGPGWLVLTEAKYAETGLCPQVFYLGKRALTPILLFEVDNHSGGATGFSYSRSSNATCGGVAFSCRRPGDAIACKGQALKWEIRFD